MSLETVTTLSRDLRSAATTLSANEARFLVDAYYMMQEDRKRAHNQDRELSKAGEPHAVITWLADQSRTLENQIKGALDKYSAASPVGEWARAQVGIGPVIAAGLLAHIDITRAPTVGHIWRYAGLDPTSQWKKGEKRPWNAALKVLCWKAGESFVKVCNNPKAFYGGIYLKRKEQEIEKNARGDFRDQAAAGAKRVGKGTEAYKWYSGTWDENEKMLEAGREMGAEPGTIMLPPAHIHSRAKRYAVKLFLAHYHEAAYEQHYGEPPPSPYPIGILGHAHRIAKP